MTLVLSFESTAELTKNAAIEVAQQLHKAIAEKGEATLVITGGSLGVQILGDLAELNLDLNKIKIWVGDERFVPMDHSDRNELQAIEAWPALANSALNRFPATGMPLDAAAESMSQEFFDQFGAVDGAGDVFDVLLLGMGPDGHVASLFPGRDHEIAWVVAEHSSPKPPPQRLSLSYQALNRSSHVIFLASGAAKSDAVKCVLQQVGCGLPAAKVKGSASTTWYLDTEISREL